MNARASTLQRFSKLPDSTACCSDSVVYVRMRCPTSVRNRHVREHLCNYCATENNNDLLNGFDSLICISDFIAHITGTIVRLLTTGIRFNNGKDRKSKPS